MYTQLELTLNYFVEALRYVTSDVITEHVRVLMSEMGL